MRQLIFLLVFSLVSCGQTKTPKDLTNEEMIKKATYRYLDEKQSYLFVNNYYLPRLDTLVTGRKIFIHPINKPDFLRRIKGDNKYYLEPLIIDSTYRWDPKKFKNIRVISNDDFNELLLFKEQDSLYKVLWKRKFNRGYVCISRPAYNPYTKRILIREWIENNLDCGTGREKLLSYKLTENGRWQIN
ncbi:hypothetical protein NF867_07560 [Solitalea sp. MAHUQ-68]|uniref:Lipoprotein n=1 Tax=Solitalea agri TaxID=2953739 RepID=A0A9X2F246_9SPHI|nr:hypothetical protein [Solitalea agri]MCO4292714.1 hypothetical protein [Solitalea agri]